MGITIGQMILYSILPFGQLFARVFLMNGSLDKSWTFIPLFFIPPFSFLPMILMKIGIIKKGKGGKPFDIFMIIPIILRIIMGILIDYFDVGFPLWMIIEIFGNLLGSTIPLIIKRTKECKKTPNHKTKFKTILIALAQAAAIQGFTGIMSILLRIIPLIKYPVRLLEAVPYVGRSLTWCIGFFPAYVIVNMINGNRLNKFCGGNIGKFWILTIVGVVVTVGSKIARHIFLDGDDD